MAKDLRNILLSEIEENKIKEKTPDKLPLNPTAEGWSGQEVRRFLAKSLIDKEGSFLAEFKKKMTEIKAQFEDVFGDGDGNIQGQIDIIIQDIAAIEENDVSTLARTVSDNYNTLDNIKVNKTLTILGIDLQDDITLSEFKTALGDATTFTNGLMSALDKENLAQTIIDIQNLFSNKADKTDIPTNVSQLNNDLLEATQALSGLMSSTDKTRLDVLHALLEEDEENSVVDSINEVLSIFNNYPEGADLVTALAGKVDKITGKGLSTNDLTNTLKSNYDTAHGWGDHATENYLKSITKAMVEAVLTGTINTHNHDGRYELSFTKNSAFNKNFGTSLNTVAQGNHLHAGVYEPANSNIQSHISSTSNPHGVTKTQVGLSNVDDTSDLNKPISTAQQTALDNKVDKVTGKGLSSNDFTTTEKNKLAGIASGAEVNVQSDWDATSGDALILNKPAIPTKVSDLTNDSEFITTETDPIFTAWNKSTGISITKSQVSDLLEATQSLSGLMSATDKQRLDVLHALLEEDTENNVVDSINEVLAIFNNYPEGADLVTALAGKVDKVSGKGLSTNDLTNTLKSNYDTAYGWGNHAVEGYLKSITKAMVEAVLTGTITSHDHDGTYEPAFTKNTAFNKNFGTSAGTVAEGNHFHNQYLTLANIIDMARYKGTYEQNGDYQKGDIVKDGNNTFYICVQSVLSGTPLPTEPSFYKLGSGGGGGSATLNFKGGFVSGSSYSAGDIVMSVGEDGGFLYLFTKDVANQQSLPELFDPYCIKIDQKAERLKVEQISSFDNKTTGLLLGVNYKFTNYGNNVLTEEFYPHTIHDLKWVKENEKFILYDGRGKLAALTDLFSKNYDDLMNKPTLFSGSYNDLANKPTLFSGSYIDLADKPTIPTKTSELVNDSGLATESYVDNKVASVYKYKGSVLTYNNLPTTNRNVGDVYDVQDTGMNYAWNGSNWDGLGIVIDLSNYYQKNETFTQNEINNMFGNKVDKNASITAGTHPKITYDAKGLVTGGAALAATDIPNLNASKINDGTFDDARIPDLDADKISSGTFDADRIPNLNANKITAGEFFVARIPDLGISKITNLQATLTSKQNKLVAGENITIDENTNVISASGGGGGNEIDLITLGYMNYVADIYYKGRLASLFSNAWESSLAVDPLEISKNSEYYDSPKGGTGQYPNGGTYGVIIPQGVTTIGDYAFMDWSSNNQPLVFPNTVTTIGVGAFRGWSSNNQPLVIPNTVTTIAWSSFSTWSSNNHPLVIPDSVTNIETTGFSSWSSNNHPLVIPNSVTNIGSNAFYGWYSNTHPIIIPSSVTSIGDSAFQDWQLVPYVEIHATTPPTLTYARAFGDQNNAPIYVPDASVTAYKTATNWVDLADRIFPIPISDISDPDVIGDIKSALDAILGV